MDILNFDSTGMYTILALIVIFQWNAWKKWTSSLKFAVILVQCAYTKIAQRVFKYSDMQYTCLTLDKILSINAVLCQHIRELQTYADSPFLAHRVHTKFSICSTYGFVDTTIYAFYQFWNLRTCTLQNFARESSWDATLCCLIADKIW